MAIIWYDTIPRLIPTPEPLNRAGFLPEKTMPVDRVWDHMAFSWWEGAPKMELLVRMHGREAVFTRPHCRLCLPGEHIQTIPMVPCNEFYFVFKHPERLFGGRIPPRGDFGSYDPPANSPFFKYKTMFLELFNGPLSPSVCTQLDCLAMAILGCTFYRDSMTERLSPIEEIEGYILNHYSDELDFPALARRFGLSFASFRRKWKERNPDPPGETVLKLRNRHACDLLRNRQRSIGEVAEMTGYPDIRYFSRFFRRMNGMTPSEFRSRMQQEKQ